MLTATDPAGQRKRLVKLEGQASAEGFWDHQDEAAAVTQEMSDINETLRLTASMQSQLEDVKTAVELIDLEVTGTPSSLFCLLHLPCLVLLLWASKQQVMSTIF